MPHWSGIICALKKPLGGHLSCLVCLVVTKIAFPCVHHVSDFICPPQWCKAYTRRIMFGSVTSGSACQTNHDPMFHPLILQQSFCSFELGSTLGLTHVSAGRDPMFSLGSVIVSKLSWGCQPRHWNWLNQVSLRYIAYFRKKATHRGPVSP